MDFLKNRDKVKVGIGINKSRLVPKNEQGTECFYKSKNLKNNLNYRLISNIQSNYDKMVGSNMEKSNIKLSQEKRLELIRESLKSLYIDRTKPHLQELFRRIKERSELNDNYNIKKLTLDLNNYSDEFILCNGSEVFFKNHQVDENHWIDPKNPENPYSAEIWNIFLQYINQLVSIKGNSILRFKDQHTDRNELLLEESINYEDFQKNRTEISNRNFQSSLLRYQFKGGRYGVALEIHKAKIAHLEKLSLGELSHLVQLAINKGILQYENNVLKPRCTCMKIAAAVLSLDIESVNSYENIIDISQLPNKLKSNEQDLNILKYQINEILKMYPKGVLLSLLKRLFYIFWGKKLSPTVHGYTRISTLLLSSEFKDLCRLYFDSFNHVLVQSTEFSIPENIRLLKEEKSSQKNSIDLNLFLPLRSMNDISFEYMRLLNI